MAFSERTLVKVIIVILHSLLTLSHGIVIKSPVQNWKNVNDANGSPEGSQANTNGPEMGKVPGTFCGKVYRAQVFEITSINYPLHSPPIRNCRSRIKPISTHVCYLDIRFHDFELGLDCSANFFRVGDGTFCGNQTGIQRIGWTGINDEVLFRTENGEVRFSITVLQRECPQKLGNAIGASLALPRCQAPITSFRFKIEGPPKEKNNGSDCVYIIQASSEDYCLVQLTVERFDMPECLQSYLEIEGTRLCGRLGHFDLSAKLIDGTLVIRFHSPSQVSSSSSFRVDGTQVLCRVDSKESVGTAAAVRRSSTGIKTVRRAPADFFPAQSSSCRAFQHGGDLVISSPGFPGGYPPNFDCDYFIMLPNSVSYPCCLHVTFVEFDLEADPTCSKDYLTFDGHRWCGYRSGTDLVVPIRRKDIRFHFHSDRFVSGRGFLLRVVPIVCPLDVVTTSSPPNYKPPISTCDQVFTSETFEMLSPNYPNTYDCNLDCRYDVRKMPGKCALEMKMVDFRLEPSSQCASDYLTVKGRRYCGTMIKQRIFLPMEPSSMTFHFHSDQNRSERGFSIIGHQLDCGLPPYVTLPPPLTTPYPEHQNDPEHHPFRPPTCPPYCHFCLNKPEGVFYSFGYPEHYRPHLDCTYNIRALPDFCSVEIRFEDFDVEVSRGCHHDYLLIDGKRYCGNYLAKKQERLVFSPWGEIDIRFVSGYKRFNCRRGFRAFYRQIPCLPPPPPTTIPPPPPPPTTLPPPSSFCDQIFNEKDFVIRSVNYPDNYPDNLDCLYTIQRFSEDVFELEVSFVIFEVQQSDDCRADYLDLVPRRFCGEQSGVNFRIPFPGSPIFFQFHSDSFVTARGYYIRVHQIEDPLKDVTAVFKRLVTDVSNCDVYLTAVSGQIKSPVLLPNRTTDISCSYIITGTPGICGATLSFSDFNLQSTTNCTDNFLEIHGKRFCGKSLKGKTSEVDVPTANHQLRVPYRISKNTIQAMWTFNYSVVYCANPRHIVEPPCNQTFSEKEGMLPDFNLMSVKSQGKCIFNIKRWSSKLCRVQIWNSGNFTLAAAQKSCPVHFLYLEGESRSLCSNEQVENDSVIVSFPAEKDVISYLIVPSHPASNVRLNFRQLDCR